MEFFPALLIILGMEILWLVTVFCMEGIVKMTDAQTLYAATSLAGIVTLATVFFLAVSIWALFWVGLTFGLAIAIHANHMGTRPISDKKD